MRLPALLLRAVGVFALGIVLIILVGGAMRAFAPNGGSGAGGVVAGVALLAAGVMMYFLPVHIAHRRNHRDSQLIALVNFFLGWTVVFWVVCLIWATRPPAAEREDGPTVIDAKDQYCRSCGTGMGFDAKFCPACGVPVGATAPVG